MTKQALASSTAVHKALGHETRLRLVAMLRAGELCVCQMTEALGLAPSTVSSHLGELRRAGLVSERRAGRWVHYAWSSDRGAAEILESETRRIGADAAIVRDATKVAALRRIPVEELCRVRSLTRSSGRRRRGRIRSRASETT